MTLNNQSSDSDSLRQDKQLWGRVMAVSNRLLDNFDLEVKSRQRMNDVFDTEILALLQAEILKALIHELEHQQLALRQRIKRTGGVVKQTLINQENRTRDRIAELEGQLKDGKQED